MITSMKYVCFLLASLFALSCASVLAGNTGGISYEEWAGISGIDLEKQYKENLANDEKQFGKDDERTLHRVLGLAQYYEKRKKYTEADAYYKRLLDKPSLPLGLSSTLGIDLANRGKLMEAERLFRSVYEAKPGVVSEIQLAEVLSREGKLGEAEKLFNAAMSRMEDPKYGFDSYRLKALTGIATIYSAKGEFSAAEQMFKGIINTARNDYDRYPAEFAYANMLQKSGRKQEAEAMRSKAVSEQSSYERRLESLR